MRELESFKQALGPEAEKYSDSQLEELRKQMYGLADLLLDMYLGREQGRAIDSPRARATLRPERSKNELTLG
jgi:hypothetical protein